MVRLAELGFRLRWTLWPKNANPGRSEARTFAPFPGHRLIEVVVVRGGTIWEANSLNSTEAVSS